MNVWNEYPEFFRRFVQAPPMLVHEDGRQSRSSAHRPMLEPSASMRPRLAIDGSNLAARIAGGRAKQSGRAFEAEIEAANEFYERHGRAVVYRRHPKVDGWGRSLRVVGRGPADFSGVVRRPDGGSVAIAFDCKVITGSASYAHAERDRHQIESLLGFRAAGGLVFLLLHCRTLDRTWLLKDLDALSRHEHVVVRSRGGSSQPTDCLPALAPTAVRDIACGTAPVRDYLALVDQVAG